MNYLQLCQRVRQEAGLSGSGPTAVANQTGENKRIVDWVASAWQDLQLHRPNWNWMKATFSFATTTDQYAYTAAQAGIVERFSSWDLSSIRLYQTSLGVSDEIEVDPWPYIDYRRIFLTGPQTASRPNCVSVAPDRKLLLGPKPNGSYTVSGEYNKAPQTLALASDTPEMPEEYHMAIVYRALMLYARYEAAGEIYADAFANYTRLVRQLELQQLPPMVEAEPLI